MTIEIPNEPLLSDADLLNEVKRLTALERQATARLIAALGELDARRLYLGEGCSSLFTYCTQVLHLSEHAAYLRIEAARAARKWPGILMLLTDGALHLTAIGLLAPHLTADNQERVLATARHKSKREVEVIVAALRPQPAVVSSVRRPAATFQPPSSERSGNETAASARSARSGTRLRARLSRVSPPDSILGWRRHTHRQPRASVSRPQCVRGGTLVRSAGRGSRSRSNGAF
jgi:hypothetical protein